MSNDKSNTGPASEQTIPIQNGRAETRQEHRYEDVMRLHEAAPKLIVQERVRERMKILSYCPVASLTRAGLALGWLQYIHQSVTVCMIPIKQNGNILVI